MAWALIRPPIPHHSPGEHRHESNPRHHHIFPVGRISVDGYEFAASPPLDTKKDRNSPAQNALPPDECPHPYPISAVSVCAASHSSCPSHRSRHPTKNNHHGS